MPMAVTKQNAQSMLQAGKLWMMVGGNEVQLKPSLKHPVQPGKWELPFQGWVGAKFVCGSIHDGWFDEVGNINASYLKVKE